MIERIGPATLHLGDARDILPTLAKADAVVTDPPYGLEDWNSRGTNAKRGQGRAWKNLGRYAGSKFDGNECAQWDQAPDAELMALVQAAGRHRIIWGANYLLDHLGRTKQLLVWNKGIRRMHFNDCEVAWCSQWKEASRVFDLHSSWVEETKDHPTQKPVALMRWCIAQLPDDVETIVDPFMGSGSTGVAAVTMGRQFVGIEREPAYFDLAAKRIEAAQRQGELLLDRVAKHKQEALL
jgi:site-specific DNA-methyltransferase (adenine-specific)